MESFQDPIRQGAAHAWLFVPSAVLLGALHGLEPGHSKTMMAAFIIAIRGTVGQAALLGLSATLSHTAVVWAVALLGLYFGSQWNPETSEPYFQVASAVLIVGVALWMVARTWRDQQRSREVAAHEVQRTDDLISSCGLSYSRSTTSARGTLRIANGAIVPFAAAFQQTARTRASLRQRTAGRWCCLRLGLVSLLFRRSSSATTPRYTVQLPA
jgi:ABC-type nickel/cobalt efflux system permease component RcnA